eukprot:3300342-Amphidinium_carterae.1
MLFVSHEQPPHMPIMFNLVGTSRFKCVYKVRPMQGTESSIVVTDALVLGRRCASMCVPMVCLFNCLDQSGQLCSAHEYPWDHSDSHGHGAHAGHDHYVKAMALGREQALGKRRK